MGVGCKLAQSVVYCMLFVMMSTNTEKKKKISCFRGGTGLDSLCFFSGRKHGQYADQELLKSLLQNETPDSSSKYILIYWSKCMTSRVNGKKKAKRKNSVKKKKKNGTKKQKTARLEKNFLCHRRCLRLVELYLSWIQIYIWGKIAYFKAISDYFGLNGSTRCR